LAWFFSLFQPSFQVAVPIHDPASDSLVADAAREALGAQRPRLDAERFAGLDLGVQSVKH
jgi:hypothetical protein